MIIKIVPAKIMVMALAVIIMGFLIKIPYNSHIPTPLTKIKYIQREMLDVSLVEIVLITCGKKLIVVRNAARYPIRLIIFLERNK